MTVVESGRRTLGDRYELLGLIASGGMGEVWRARDTLLGRPVAVKVLRSEYTGDPTFLARFRAEAQHTARLSHRHIAAVHDYGEVASSDGTRETLAYLVMELVDGEPLSARLAREGALDTRTTLVLLQQAAAGLAVAHRAGLVHRDVKPGNMLVRTDGSVAITDFGIAWSAASVPLTQTGQVIGTPHYLSPEQARGRLATPASDIYALGMVGYECLTGHKAFDGANSLTIAMKQLYDDPEPLPEGLPIGVRTLIERALLKDPAERFADGAEFGAAVAAVVAGRSLPERPSPERPPPGRSPAVRSPVVRSRLAAGREPRPATAPPALTSGGSADRMAAGAPAHATGGSGPVRRRPDSAGGRRPAARRRRGSVLAPVLALVVGAVIAAFGLQQRGGSDPRPATVAAETHAAAPLVLAADDYLGRPVDDVVAELVALGLTVHRQQVVTADVTRGLVIGIDPARVALAAGDPVVVRYAAAPPTKPTDDGADVTAAETGVATPSADSGAATAEPAASPTTPGADTAASASPTGPPATDVPPPDPGTDPPPDPTSPPVPGPDPGPDPDPGSGTAPGNQPPAAG